MRIFSWPADYGRGLGGNSLQGLPGRRRLFEGNRVVDGTLSKHSCVPCRCGNSSSKRQAGSCATSPATMRSFRRSMKGRRQAAPHLAATCAPWPADPPVGRRCRRHSRSVRRNRRRRRPFAPISRVSSAIGKALSEVSTPCRKTLLGPSPPATGLASGRSSAPGSVEKSRRTRRIRRPVFEGGTVTADLQQIEQQHPETLAFDATVRTNEGLEQRSGGTVLPVGVEHDNLLNAGLQRVERHARRRSP